ncbi:UDP-3-O-(3-hydroxymyristoyl)glucosamine N-acyltransferase [Janthinobacterium sp. 17J80-10]|uniref:UDP-3-O-(3-hydroxymyristoyl)glucosamine N-acyltransferase n=1 Tax=Janthinobacterium sp. 17J80-10 TaxID=2497863 RepID=UPI001005A620|nr:UDP-3-O-(3-hydroxymyristoyl)glucosamine N-acyltransferase [Janthinobacterium sp. 17J80-10]QAU34619.1 UDP-3-O-(3-hydroxymyristoyl)glucosamine N-acyltransferase [Janthinobacterium sp. 17J80-10]
MSILLKDLVERLGGQLIGDATIEVVGIAPLGEADQSHVTFLSTSKLRAQAARTRAAALILSPGENDALGADYQGARIVSDNPYAYFARTAQYFASLKAVAAKQGIHASAVVDPAAQISDDASIGPQAVIEADAHIGAGAVIGAGCFIGRGAKIGAGTRLHSRVSFYDACEIGARGIVHSGAVIGADGFGFASDKGTWVKIPQTGRVVIGDDVEIGANTTIDRGAMADTVIEDGVKLDNQIQIGHNCHVGAHTLMSGCTGVAGSAKIGKHCTFGGAAMVLGHLSIADHVTISSGSFVSRTISQPGFYTGIYPLAKNADWEKSAVIVRNLPAMREKIRELEKIVKSLTEESE